MNQRLLVGIAAALAGCGGGMGAERQACFPNKTCNDGLVCLSDVCVVDDGRRGGGTATGGGSGGGTRWAAVR